MIDEGRHELRLIDLSACHLEKVQAVFPADLPEELLLIIDLSDGRDGVAPMLGAEQERLGVIVGDAADPEIPPHLVQLRGKFSPEGRISDIMDRATEAVLPVKGRETAPPGAKMRMIIRPEEKIEDTVFLQRRRKKTAHELSFPDLLIPGLIIA